MINNQDYLLLDSIQEYVQDYLNQAFLVYCLVKISKQIVENERVVRKAIEDSDSFVTADAWIKCAKEALSRFDKQDVETKTQQT